MEQKDWFKETAFAVTICDTNGIVVYMNEKSEKTFEKWGGKELIGKSLFGCHSDKSVLKIKELIATKGTNSYTIDKNGIKKLIYQTPWYNNGEVAGLVELSLEIPHEMPHFVR